MGDHRIRPRGDGERRLVCARGDLHLHHRLPLLRPVDRDEGRSPARRPRHAGRNSRRRHRLRADRPARAVRPPFRRHRWSRTTRRPGAGRPNGLSTLQHLDHLRRGVRRCRPGLPGVVDLHAAARPFPGPDGPRRDRRGGRSRSPHRGLRHHGDHHCRAGTGRGAGTFSEPLGSVLHRHDHPHRPVHGLLPAIPTSRAGDRSIGDRLCATDARRGLRQFCRRNILGHILVEPHAR